MSSKSRLTLAVPGIFFFCCAAVAAPVFTVNSALDQIDDDVTDGVCHTAAGTCTLRAAVMQANKISGAGATIILPSGTYTLTRPIVTTDADDSGDLNLSTPASGNPVINIVGAGPSTTIIDGSQIDAIFNVENTRTANISGVTIRNGYANGLPSYGGGILNEGNLSLSNVVVSNNFATVGGGIATFRSLSIINSSVINNSATNYGGGIYSEQAGPTMIIASTIAFNTALGGAGISSNALTMVNSTVANNIATENGGAIYEFSSTPPNIYNSTIAFNDANHNSNMSGSGGGVYSQQATVNIRNTLLAGNTINGGLVKSDCNSAIASLGRNRFGTLTGCTFVGGGDMTLLNSVSFLGSLNANGGPTQTVALLAGSNAINQGDPVQGCIDMNLAILGTDQRGFARVVGPCDIGAFEFGAPPDRIFKNGFD